MHQTFTFLIDQKLINMLNAGAVGVLPTDTVYGLVCQAADETAVKRLYSLKKRSDKPGTVITASADQLIELGFKARYVKAVAHFWPGPLSIVLPCGDELAHLHLGRHSLAARVVADKELANLLKQTGALLTTSANHPGEPPATTIEQAKEYFGEKVEFYVDGGDLGGRQPSTVIRIIDDAIEVLRKGSVNIDETGKIK